MSDATVTKQIECVVPIVSVASIAQSIEYYGQCLGFQVDWQYRDGKYAISGISRDGHAIYLCEDDQGNPGTWIWMGVERVDQLYEEFRTSGANIIMAPTEFPWGCEFRVSDLDGHVIRFGGESSVQPK
jgi:uncharacterized glyoxalase superfamily protein PhnB